MKDEIFAFISYASLDQSLATDLSAALDKADIRNFLAPKAINLGDNFKTSISDGLESCSHLVLIASPSSLKSPWVSFELGQAIALRKRILTLLTHPGLDLPSFLSDFQHADSITRVVESLERQAAAQDRPRGLFVSYGDNPESTDSVVLKPSETLVRFMDRFPPAHFHGHVAIDGAVELHTFPSQVNQYGGIGRQNCRTIARDIEWSDLARTQLPQNKLQCLGDGLRAWIGDRQAKPNRIRYLVEPPAQMVLDNNEFQLMLGNSDYFTMRTVTELSLRSQEARDSDGIESVFDEFWGEPKQPLAATVVPYHISAHGVLFVVDPETRTKYLVLTLPSRQRKPLVPGWNVSFAEQMWAPSKRSTRPSWWEPYAYGLTLAPPNQRTGDSDLWDTVLRGLHEELGIESSDLTEQPRLIASCIEQDMYFVAFVFILHAELSLAQLQKRRLASPDKEIGPIAAYPVEGHLPNGDRLEPLDQCLKLLSNDTFDGGPFLIPTAATTLQDRWHLSSRYRLYAALRHLYGNRVLDHVSPTY